MSAEEFQIRIDSILGGQSEFAAFSGPDQFLASYNLDPDQPIADSGSQSYRPSGFLRPTPPERIDFSFSGAIKWFIPNPKNDEVYVYGSTGSVYSINPSNYTVTSVGDLTDGGTSTANGGEYYDNYIYFARDTTVARYGPLNGGAVFTDDYWVTSLSQTALVNTTYPQLYLAGQRLPNHVMHRHSDGRLYFADVIGNQGYLHFISTLKTTVEGDTDNGSTYGALDFPYGWWPTDIETYGSDLAVALYEGNNDSVTFQKRAKLTFWDTTSAAYSKVIDVEFPDPVITALENVNGVLYVFSGQIGAVGTRVSRFIGGYSYEQVAFIEDSEPPFPGATDHLLNRVLFGGSSEFVNGSVSKPNIWALGSKTGKSLGLFNIMGATGSSAITEITAAKVIDQDGFNFQIPVVAWSDGVVHGIDRQTTNYDKVNTVFRSQVYRMGRPFKIKKIRLPLTKAMAANMTIVPKIYVDEQIKTYTLQTINNTNYPNGEQQIVLRSDSSSAPITGLHSFFFELTWSGSALQTVGLPITIEGEYLND